MTKNIRKSKTYYVTLRLKFDEPVVRQEALKLARANLPDHGHGIVLRTKKRSTVPQYVEFKIARLA